MTPGIAGADKSKGSSRSFSDTGHSKLPSSSPAAIYQLVITLILATSLRRVQSNALFKQDSCFKFYTDGTEGVGVWNLGYGEAEMIDQASVAWDRLQNAAQLWNYICSRDSGRFDNIHLLIGPIRFNSTGPGLGFSVWYRVQFA